MMYKIAIAGMLLLLVNNVELRPAQAMPSSDSHEMLKMKNGKFKDWLLRWERSILSENSMQYCGTEMGEEIGWKISPFLKGFYYGYLATGNLLWVDKLVACTDAWFNRAVKEPDGYFGWPKVGAAGTAVDVLDDFYADSMLGEAMGLTPGSLMSVEMRRDPLLKEKYSSKAEEYLKSAEQIFEKWDSRGVWRETDNGGMVTVELPFE